jgi:hypothetical protein
MSAAMPSRSNSPIARRNDGMLSIASTRASESARGAAPRCSSAGLGLLRLFDDRVHVLLGLLRDEVERPPPRLVLRDLGPFEPAAVDVAEQVVLRADLGAELLERETGAGGIGHAVQRNRPYLCAASACGLPCVTDERMLRRGVGAAF